jgi:GGDEF domain-containing protein
VQYKGGVIMRLDNLSENIPDLFLEALMGIEDGIAIIDEHSNTVFANNAASIMIEDIKEEISKKIREVKHSSEDSLEFHHIRRAGRWLRYYVKRLSVSERVFFLFVVEDISDLKLAEQTISQLAHFDGETGLPNYVLFRDRVNMALFRSRRNNSSSMVAAFEFVSKGGVSSIEESTIIDMAHSLVRGIRKNDTLCRFSRREFLLLAEDLKDYRNASTILRKALNAFKIWQENCGEFSMELRAGFVLLPRDGVDAEQLVNKAFASIHSSEARK